MRLKRVSRRQKRSRLDADAGHCEWSSWARMRTAARCSWLRMQACCTWRNRLRMQAVAVPQTAKHCSGNEARQGWCAALAGMSVMQLGANADVLQREQPTAAADCCRASNSEAMQR